MFLTCTGHGRGACAHDKLSRVDCVKPTQPSLFGNQHVRLLLVEDDRMLARRMVAALDQSGYGVDVAATAADAVRMAQEMPYELCILDLGLPDGDGLDVLRSWHEGGSPFPVLVLSARGDLQDRVDGLDAGADDYLAKPFALSEIEARIRALLRRPKDQVEWQQLGRLFFDRSTRRALVDGREVDLTKREAEVLELLMSRVGRVASKEALIESVFPFEADVGPNALEAHVSRLRSKLKPAGLNIRSLRGLGYRIEEALDAGDGSA